MVWKGYRTQGQSMEYSRELSSRHSMAFPICSFQNLFQSLLSLAILYNISYFMSVPLSVPFDSISSIQNLQQNLYGKLFYSERLIGQQHILVFLFSTPLLLLKRVWSFLSLNIFLFVCLFVLLVGWFF